MREYVCKCVICAHPSCRQQVGEQWCVDDELSLPTFGSQHRDPDASKSQALGLEPVKTELQEQVSTGGAPPEIREFWRAAL